MRIAERALEIINEARDFFKFDGVTKYVTQEDIDIVEVDCWDDFEDMSRNDYKANDAYIKKLNNITKVKRGFRVLPKGVKGTLAMDDEGLTFVVDGVKIPMDGYGSATLKRLFKRDVKLGNSIFK